MTNKEYKIQYIRAKVSLQYVKRPTKINYKIKLRYKNMNGAINMYRPKE